MKKDFENYLLKNGFKMTTPGGRPSTIYDYLRGLDSVCKHQKMSITDVAKNINTLVISYQPGGEHFLIGRRISRSVRSSLVQFSKFVNENKSVAVA